MDESIFMCIFFGLIFGAIGGILFIKLKKYLFKRSIFKKIEKQKIKIIVDKKPFNFSDEINNESKTIKKEIIPTVLDIPPESKNKKEKSSKTKNIKIDSKKKSVKRKIVKKSKAKPKKKKLKQKDTKNYKK